MIENPDNLLSVKEVAERLGLSNVTVTKKLKKYSLEGIIREGNKIMVSSSVIPKLKVLLDYNDNFDEATYYSTSQVAKIISREIKQTKRTDINNWLKKGRYNSILHMGFRYIHENDLKQMIEDLENLYTIPEYFCTVEDGANFLGIHVQTIRVWIKEGDIEAKQVIINGKKKTMINKDDLKVVQKQKRLKMLGNLMNVESEDFIDYNISEKKKVYSENKVTINNFWDLNHIAKLLQIRTNTLRTYIKNGKFPSAVKLKNKWYISKEDVLSYQEKIKNREGNTGIVISNNDFPSGYLPISEVSKRLDLSKSYIRNIIKENLFPNSKKINRKWFLLEEDIDLFLEKKMSKKISVTPIKFTIPSGYLTTDEIARQMNTTPSKIVRLIKKENNFKGAKKIKKRWIVPEKDFMEYIQKKEKEKISINKPDLIRDLKNIIYDNQDKSHLKKTIKFYDEFSTTRLNATNGRKNNFRRVFTHLRKLYFDVIINLEGEIFELEQKKIEAILSNEVHSNPIRENFLKFFRYSLFKVGKNLDVEYVFSRNESNTDRDIDSERYSPEEYYLFDQHVKDIEKHISYAVKNRQYANMWVLTTMLLTNAWRPSDVIFEMPNIDIEVVNIFNLDWFENNYMSKEQCYMIINQLRLKLNNSKVSKTREDLHFLVSPDMVTCLAYSCVISELHCRLLVDKDLHSETQQMLLGTFIKKNTEETITSGTNTHKKFFMDKPELYNFSSRKLNNSTMTYLFLNISEEENISELALEIPKNARSHNDINVTAGYVKLTNKDGTLERVSINLFKRGHFGWLYNFMVQFAFRNLGITQTLEERTNTIIELRKEYTPIQLEEWSKTLIQYKDEAQSVINRLYKMNKEQLKEIILKIYRGEMPSRDGCGQCLTFPHCSFSQRKTCIGCVNFIPQLHQVLIEASEEFYRLINNIKKSKTEAILKRDTKFLINVLLLFNEAAGTFGNETISAFLPLDERESALYSIAEKLQLSIDR